MLHLLLLFLSAPAFAASVAADRCQEQCTLERRDDGRTEVNCSCGRGHGGLTPASLTAPYASRRAFPLAVAAPQAEEEIARCEASQKVESAGYTGARELLALASRKTLPLCECVAARVRLPVKKNCENRPTGETACSFSPDFSRPSLDRPLRKATLEDYQSCLMAAKNYERPATCAKVARCQSRRPECEADQELVNVADPEACCPAFVCRKVSA